MTRDGGGVALADYRGDALDALIPMWRASFEAGVGVKDPHPLDEQRRYFLSQVVPHHAVRLAFLDGGLVGFIAASRESIAQLYVRVGFQRRGIGTTLLEWAKLQSSGSLWLYTFARNAGARAFYERNGFVPVALGFEPMWQLEDVKYRWSARMQDPG
jgi:ribosomal protein S18 acetylase RimI-like enzyme